MVDCFLECQPFGLILDALHDGVTIYDRHGALIWINKKACQILGMSRDELIGRNVSEIATLPTVESLTTPELAGQSLSDIRDQKTHLEDYASPGYMTFTNGKQILYMGSYVRDAQGDIQYAIGTIRDVTDLNTARRQVGELQRLTSLYEAQLRTLHTQVLGRDIIYQSDIMQQVLERTLRYARLDGNILLTGETGVGKTLLARYIHVMSRRTQGPFIHVNCASLPESLVEAELFGYSEGAFTGASRKGRRGLIELGHSGTVFLDEIGDMPVGMQAKLLTVLEDKVIRRIGGEKWTPVDVRFIAATNKKPDCLLQEKTLRDDLYYRLAMNRIDLPPLRERPDDIPCLIEHALAEFNDKNGTDLSLHADLLHTLQTLPLPGNVRELKNMVWQLASEGGVETGEVSWPMLSPDFAQALEQQAGTSNGQAAVSSTKRNLAEERQLRELCHQHKGDVHAIANALGVHRTTAIRKLRHYGLVYARKKSARSARTNTSTARVSPAPAPTASLNGHDS